MKKIFQKGFTLVELLIVISIIGILVTMGSMSYVKSLNKARDAKKVTETKEIQKALELYYSIVGSYPATGSLSVLTTGTTTYYKGDVAEYTYTLTSGVYCLCSSALVVQLGNETSSCNIGGVTPNDRFCVESLQ